MTNKTGRKTRNCKKHYNREIPPLPIERVHPLRWCFVQRCHRIWAVVSTNRQVWTVAGEASVDETIY